jgi:hypothetical protein
VWCRESESLLPPLCLFVLFCFRDKGSHCVAQAGLELSIPLPQPPEGWDHTQLYFDFFFFFAVWDLNSGLPTP